MSDYVTNHDYIIYFQLSGVILLVAMIGSIVLTLRERPGVRRQNISNQLDILINYLRTTNFFWTRPFDVSKWIKYIPFWRLVMS